MGISHPIVSFQRIREPDAAKTENLFSGCIVREMQKVNTIHGFLDTVMSVRSPKTLLLLPNDINLPKMILHFFVRLFFRQQTKLIVTFSVNRKLNESNDNKIGLV